MARVMALLPRAGLGNKLLVWAKAVAFARRHNLELATFGWNNLRSRRAFLHRERDLDYGRYLHTGGLGRYLVRLRGAFDAVVNEPALDEPIVPGSCYVFREIPPWSDYFGYFRSERDVVRDAFCALATDGLRSRLAACDRPVIAVHIRHGDFRQLRPEEDFRAVGAVRTPLAYFRDVVEALRDCAGATLPVMVFSDGSDTDLTEILALEAVRRAPDLPDVGHLCLMSDADIIVTSASSTFSLWAGFVSNAALILHPDHIHAPIRPGGEHASLYEGAASGPWTGWPDALVQAVKAAGRAEFSAAATLGHK